MTLDPRQHVKRGQRISIAAEQINYLNRLMRGGGKMSGGPLGPGFSAPHAWVYAKNSTDSAIARWGVMEISGTEIAPTSDDSDSATQQFVSMPVLTGGDATEGSGSWCIAIEPIASGQVGKVAVSGVVPVKLEIVNEDHATCGPKNSSAELISGAIGADIVWKESGTGTGKWALVRIGGDDWRCSSTGGAIADRIGSESDAETSADGVATGTEVQLLVNNFGCAQWVYTQKIQVLTDVQIDGTNLNFTTKEVYVLMSANDPDDVVIEGTDCA